MARTALQKDSTSVLKFSFLNDKDTDTSGDKESRDDKVGL